MTRTPLGDALVGLILGEGCRVPGVDWLVALRMERDRAARLLDALIRRAPPGAELAAAALVGEWMRITGLGFTGLEQAAARGAQRRLGLVTARLVVAAARMETAEGWLAELPGVLALARAVAEEE